MDIVEDLAPSPPLVPSTEVGAGFNVTQDKTGWWIATATIDSKQRFLGRFQDRSDAEAALAEEDATIPPSPQLESVDVDVDVDVTETVESLLKEAMRSLVNFVARKESRPDAPSHYGHPAPAALARRCRFGVECQRADIYHWSRLNDPMCLSLLFVHSSFLHAR